MSRAAQVRRRRRAAPAVAAACVALVLAGACTSEPKVASTSTPAAAKPDGGSLPPVSLPDLSRMEKSVQQQMDERYRTLTSKIDDHSTPTLELGKAYGEMGNLLLAAEYFEAAESCYLHAQALGPTE